MAARPGREAEADQLTRPRLVDLTVLAEQIRAVAAARGVTVGTAESCTGGLIGHVITEVPGSSAYYVGGIISYSNELKIASLGVSEEAIRTYGAVSAQVAAAMADGIRSRIGSDFGVAVTGVAGPDGGTPEKPIGLTFVAASGPAGSLVRQHRWTGDRHDNKLDSARAALELLQELMLAGERTSEPS